MSDAHEFKLLRFNPRRARRGAWAAEVCCSFDGLGDDVLWMDEKAIKLNIKEFGPHPELLKALEHYRTWKEFPEREAVDG